MPDDRGQALSLREKRVGILYASIAVVFFSTSPVFVRWASGFSPFVVTCVRMLIGSATVFLMSLFRAKDRTAERRRIALKEWPRFAVWGLVTALHFGLYIASLGLTTVAHSLALVYTSPVWVSILGWVVLKEPLPRRKWAAIGLTVAGMVILSGFEAFWTARMLLGDLLALGSAIAFGVYSVVGRAQRSRYSLYAYAGTVYGAAGLWLFPAAVATFRPPEQLVLPALSVLMLGVFPLGIGHTLYNAALRRAHSTLVNVIATQEVTMGVLLSWWLLGEAPSASSLLGALFMLLGVVWVVV